MGTHTYPSRLIRRNISCCQVLLPASCGIVGQQGPSSVVGFSFILEAGAVSLAAGSEASCHPESTGRHHPAPSKWPEGSVLLDSWHRWHGFGQGQCWLGGYSLVFDARHSLVYRLDHVGWCQVRNKKPENCVPARTGTFQRLSRSCLK